MIGILLLLIGAALFGMRLLFFAVRLSVRFGRIVFVFCLHLARKARWHWTIYKLGGYGHWVRASV